MRSRTREEIERREKALKEVMRIIIETNETVGDAKQFVGCIQYELTECANAYLSKARAEVILREMEIREKRQQSSEQIATAELRVYPNKEAALHESQERVQRLLDSTRDS